MDRDRSRRPLFNWVSALLLFCALGGAGIVYLAVEQSQVQSEAQIVQRRVSISFYDQLKELANISDGYPRGDPSGARELVLVQLNVLCAYRDALYADVLSLILQEEDRGLPSGDRDRAMDFLSALRSFLSGCPREAEQWSDEQLDLFTRSLDVFRYSCMGSFSYSICLTDLLEALDQNDPDLTEALRAAG